MKKHGFVYFITAHDSGLTKVGFSSDPAKRLKQLQTGHSSKLRISMQIRTKNPRALEARLHLLFRHKRQAGEWFRLDKEDFNLITREFSDASLGETIASAIRDCFISPNVLDSNMEPANIVDAMQNVAKALESIKQQNEVISKKIYESAMLIAGASSKPLTQENAYPLPSNQAKTPPIMLIQELDRAWNSFLANCGMTLSASLACVKPRLIEPFPTDLQGQANVLLLWPQSSIKDMNFAKSRSTRFIDFGMGISSRHWVFHFKLEEPITQNLNHNSIRDPNDVEHALEVLRQKANTIGGANL